MRHQNTPHDLKVGTIISNSWGYDQTTVSFYQVVKTTPFFVYLRPISDNIEQTGFMSGQASPNPGDFTSDEVTRHKVTVWPKGTFVNFEFGGSRIWNPGDTCYTSWYA